MNHNLQQYWTLAEKGEDGSAFEKAFDDDHPVATRILTINAFALLTLIIATGFLLVPVSGEQLSSERKMPPEKKRNLEEPALLHQAGR